MGVSGSGKTTVGEILAKAVGVEYAEADDFHSPAHKSLMAAGVPLTDEQRWPWLSEIRSWINARASLKQGAVVSCSALKRSYRRYLEGADAAVIFIWLAPPVEVLERRMKLRTGHFMPASLLQSQLTTLEALSDEEVSGGAMVFDREQSAEQIVAEIISRYGDRLAGPVGEGQPAGGS